ncbi:MAG: cytochrome b561 domain-containing protein [Spirochaetia bacterium]|jgi:uncharacterized iron-regulated membrane protein|nr:cytochrome b561 domain-containing protein [Spirochaetia bacterium]
MSYYSQILLHMILMMGFLVFAAAGIITAKYFKKRNPKWLKVHKLLMISGVSSGMLGFIWIFYVVQTGGGVHFTIPHTIFGLVTVLIALTAPILGFRFMSKKTDNSKKPLLRKLHKTIGWFSIILILSTVLTGLILFGIIALPF